MSCKSERVLVVKKRLLSPQGSVPAQGFQNGDITVLLQRIEQESFFIQRRQAENCDRVKQIILYLVLRHQKSLFVYQRVNATAETRLMFKYSIGLGGHINPVKNCLDINHLFSINLYRELTEEVNFTGPFSYRLIGTVNDESTEVGKYHFGLVFLVSCTTPDIQVKETDKLTGSLQSISQAAAYLSYMETWSSMVMPDISKIIR